MSHVFTSSFLTVVAMVASVLVLLYALGYFAILYSQYTRKKLRWDWSISVIFYLGIVLITIWHVLYVLHPCFGAICIGDVAPLYIVALVLFVIGFEKRARASEHVELTLLKKPGKGK